MVYKRNENVLSVFFLYLVHSKNPEAIVLKTIVTKGIQRSLPTWEYVLLTKQHH